MGSIYDIMDAFRSHKGLIDIPDAWKRSLEESPEASCWYPAHISCQVCCILLSTGRRSL